MARKTARKKVIGGLITSMIALVLTFIVFGLMVFVFKLPNSIIGFVYAAILLLLSYIFVQVVRSSIRLNRGRGKR